jgi:hypothetical protein
MAESASELFLPRTAFDVSCRADGSIRLVELVEVPQVKAVPTREGFLMQPVKLSRQSIRADRDL